MKHKISSCVVFFQAIGKRQNARIAGGPSLISFAGGTVEGINVAEVFVESPLPIQSVSFALSYEKLANHPEIAPLLDGYSGPLQIQAIGDPQSVVDFKSVDMVAVLYLFVPTIPLLATGNNLDIQISTGGSVICSSAARVLGEPRYGCNLQIEEAPCSSLSLAQTLVANGEAIVEVV